MQTRVDCQSVIVVNELSTLLTALQYRSANAPSRVIAAEGHKLSAVQSQNSAMNRDEGSYQLSHAYDRFLDATADRRIKTRKN